MTNETSGSDEWWAGNQAGDGEGRDGETGLVLIPLFTPLMKEGHPSARNSTRWLNTLPQHWTDGLDSSF